MGGSKVSQLSLGPGEMRGNKTHTSNTLIKGVPGCYRVHFPPVTLSPFNTYLCTHSDITGPVPTLLLSIWERGLFIQRVLILFVHRAMCGIVGSESPHN